MNTQNYFWYTIICIISFFFCIYRKTFQRSYLIILLVKLAGYTYFSFYFVPFYLRRIEYTNSIIKFNYYYFYYYYSTLTIIKFNQVSQAVCMPEFLLASLPRIEKKKKRRCLRNLTYTHIVQKVSWSFFGFPLYPENLISVFTIGLYSVPYILSEFRDGATRTFSVFLSHLFLAFFFSFFYRAQTYSARIIS